MLAESVALCPLSYVDGGSLGSFVQKKDRLQAVIILQ